MSTQTNRIKFIPGIGINIVTPRAVAVAAGWWLSGGISAGDCVAAYQPKGAADFATSNVNLKNPGTLDLTWISNPSWSSGNGWETAQNYTTYTLGTSNSITPFNGGAFSVAWRGNLPAGYHMLFGNTSSNWAGLIGHTAPSPAITLYIGANADYSPRFGDQISATADGVVVYCKRSDNSQSLYVNGVATASSPKAGTAYSLNSCFVGTGGGNCKAVAIYTAAIDSAQSDLYAAMAAL